MFNWLFGKNEDKEEPTQEQIDSVAENIKHSLDGAEFEGENGERYTAQVLSMEEFEKLLNQNKHNH